MRCSDYPRPVFTLIFAPVHNLCSCQELLWKTLQGEVRETITTGREKTVPLTRAYLLPSRIVSLLSIFRSLHHISKLVLPLAWLQTLHTRNNICFSWSLIPLLHCCKLLKWGTDVSPLLWGVEVSSRFSKMSFYTQARRMQIPQHRVSSFPLRASQEGLGKTKL